MSTRLSGLNSVSRLACLTSNWFRITSGWRGRTCHLTRSNRYTCSQQVWCFACRANVGLILYSMFWVQKRVPMPKTGFAVQFIHFCSIFLCSRIFESMVPECLMLSMITISGFNESFNFSIKFPLFNVSNLLLYKQTKITLFQGFWCFRSMHRSLV